jgi:primase-polymerase (primpol)-like protein
MTGNLSAEPKWVAWRYHQRGNGKPTKLPVNPHDGRLASVSNPATWGTFERAEAQAEANRLAGVGLVLAADDGLTGADLDGVRDPVNLITRLRSVLREIESRYHAVDR